MTTIRYEWLLASASLGRLPALRFLLVIIGKRIARFFLVLTGLRKPFSQALSPPMQSPKKGIRVMFVASDNSASSGAFRSMAVLAGLLQREYRVEVLVALPGQGTGTELLAQEGIPHFVVTSYDWTIPMGLNLKCRQNARSVARMMVKNDLVCSLLRKIIRQYQVDLVHVNTTWTYVGAVAACAENVPFVWHLREFLEEDQGRTMWSRSIGNALIAKATAAIAISDSLKAKYSSCVSSEKLAMIMNGIDDSLFPKTQRNIFCEKPFTFVMLGSFRRHKGHLEFANACAELYKGGFHDFRVWFIGGGDDDIRSECMTILESAGMSEIVTFMGFQKHPERFLLQADVAFMCSRSEAFGRVTVEAMMSGCLVIGAETAATAELIQDGETGLLYPYEQDSTSAIVAKMRQAVSEPDRMRTIAAAGKDYAFRHFTAKRNAEAVAALYRTILPPAACSRSQDLR
jgi:glycosyltransferase involved in cell wall biosynthesis